MLMKTLSRYQRFQILKSAKTSPFDIWRRRNGCNEGRPWNILGKVEKHGQVKYKIFKTEKAKCSLNLLNIKNMPKYISCTHSLLAKYYEKSKSPIMYVFNYMPYMYYMHYLPTFDGYKHLM